MPPLVHLIRHGETEWALTSRHTGRTDIPLSAHGEHESQQWATHLRSICFDHVLTSPLQRTRRTCELCGLSQTAQIEPDLAEWDYGDYEGQRSVDICATRPGWNLFRDGCPNGESPKQVTARADRLIAHLRMLEGHIALFSHGQFGGVLAGRWIGLKRQPLILRKKLLCWSSISNMKIYHSILKQMICTPTMVQCVWVMLFS